MSHGWFVSFHGTEFRFIPAPWVTEDPEKQEPNLLVRVSSSPYFWLFLRMEHPIIQLSGPLRSPTALTLPLGPILLHVEPWEDIFFFTHAAWRIWLGWSCTLLLPRLVLCADYSTGPSSFRMLGTKNWQQPPCACMPQTLKNSWQVFLRIVSLPCLDLWSLQPGYQRQTSPSWRHFYFYK